MSNDIIDFPGVKTAKKVEEARQKLLKLEYYLVFMADGDLFHSVGYNKIPNVGEYVMIFQQMEEVLDMDIEEFASLEAVLMTGDSFVHFLEMNDVSLDELNIGDLE